jgi:hypothetical protein
MVKRCFRAIFFRASGKPRDTLSPKKAKTGLSSFVELMVYLPSFFLLGYCGEVNGFTIMDVDSFCYIFD